MTEMNIVEYDDIRESLEEVKGACNFIPDVTTAEGYDKSKRVSLDVGKLLTSLEKKRKEKKSYFLEGGKQVDSQAKLIAAELELFQLPHKEAYKELDALKKEREVKRKADLEERVRVIRELPEAMRETSSIEVRFAIESLQSEECLDFYEYTEQALKARNASRKELSEMFGNKLQAEQEAEELNRLRVEAEERAVKDREDNIRREASEKAEAEKSAAIEREQQAKQDAIRAEQAKIDAEKRALEAEKNAEHLANLAAERARLVEVARVEQQQKDEAAELAKREANKKNIGKIRREAKEDLIALGATEAMAKKIILAIHGEEVRNIQINY